MKKLLLLLCFLPFSFLHSQYIFNSCNTLPSYGDSLVALEQYYDTTGIDAGSSGANVTWTFNSANTSANNVTHIYFAPSATTGSGMFPKANLADSTNDGWITYYDYSQDSITCFGQYKNANNFIAAWDPQKYLTCSLNFGNSYSDFHSYYTGIFCPVHHVYMNRTITYDGYGILNIKKAAFSVARIKIFSTGIDSVVCLPTLTRTDIIDTTYIWYNISTGLPQLMWEYNHATDSSGANFYYKTVKAYYYSYMPTEIEKIDVKKESISIFPNPANGNFTIEGLNTPYQVEIYNSEGKKVFDKKNSTNENRIILNEPNGIYFLNVKAGDKNFSKKILLQ